MADAQHNMNGKHELAPWLPIPLRSVAAIEHPCIVKNIDKGIASLGGRAGLAKGLTSKLEPRTNADGEEEPPNPITASLRPDDPFAKRLLATPVNTNNLLLKVTVPKRTGRKRKRGSSGPFLAAADTEDLNGASNASRIAPKPYIDAATIFRSIQDNASNYSVAVSGVIDETHRFRTLPDIQCTATDSSTMNDIKDHLLPLRLSQLQNYNLNTEAGAKLDKHVAPSADFVQMPVAHNYRFQQNPFIKYTKDRGEVNIHRSLAYNGYTIIKPDAEAVPTGPKANLPPEENLTPYSRTLIARIKAELRRRPIITRHILFNKLGWERSNRVRQAAVYCGYFFESGPWREALIAWDLDPRTHPRYRHYQTVSFASYLKSEAAKRARESAKQLHKSKSMSAGELAKHYKFDGVNVSHTGSLFQFCDISDPIIRKVLDTTNIRTSCAPTFQGWYHVGTWAKATVILKDKMNRLLQGESPDNSIYERVLTWPEKWDDQEISEKYRHEYYDREFHQANLKEHGVIRSVRWAARNPRYAFEKMEASDGACRPQELVAEEGLIEVEVPEDMTEAPDTAQAILNEGDEDPDDEDDYNEDDSSDEEVEDGQEEDMKALWGDSEGSDSESPPPSRAASEGPLPFGGLYKV